MFFFKTFTLRIRPTSNVDELIRHEIAEVLKKNPDYTEIDREIAVAYATNNVIILVVNIKFDVR